MSSRGYFCERSRLWYLFKATTMKPVPAAASSMLMICPEQCSSWSFHTPIPLIIITSAAITLSLYSLGMVLHAIKISLKPKICRVLPYWVSQQPEARATLIHSTTPWYNTEGNKSPAHWLNAEFLIWLKLQPSQNSHSIPFEQHVFHYVLMLFVLNKKICLAEYLTPDLKPMTLSWKGSNYTACAPSAFFPLKGPCSEGNCFLSSLAVLGSGVQMGLISDRPHTILKAVDGVYFYEGPGECLSNGSRYLHKLKSPTRDAVSRLPLRRGIKTRTGPDRLRGATLTPWLVVCRRVPSWRWNQTGSLKRSSWERGSEHVFGTRDRECVYKNSSNQHGRGMFPGSRCNGAAVDSAGMSVWVWVCVCLGGGTQRAIGGCKGVVRRVKRLTEGTAWTQQSPRDLTVINEFMLTSQALTQAKAPLHLGASTNICMVMKPQHMVQTEKCTNKKTPLQLFTGLVVFCVVETTAFMTVLATNSCLYHISRHNLY